MDVSEIMKIEGRGKGKFKDEKTREELFALTGLASQNPVAIPSSSKVLILNRGRAEVTGYWPNTL